MYESHWGLRQPAFRNVLDPRRYFAGNAHEEALARLQFLVDQHWRLGLLTGQGGSGKSLVLQVLAAALRHRGLAVAQINLRGLDPQEFLWRLAAGIGLNPDGVDSPFALWQLLDDQLAANRYEQRSTVVLLDSFESASPAVLAFVSRLAHTEEVPGLELSIVASGHEHQRPHLGRDLAQLVDLRIDMAGWSQLETAGYVRETLARVGASRPIFDESGLARLYELSHGLPRRVNQLAELALLAGAGDELETIDAETVESVYLELSFADAAA